MRKIFHHLKLKTKLIILIFLVFILAVIAENIYIIRMVNNDYYDDVQQQVESVADIIASSSQVINDIEKATSDNLADIQNYAEHARQLSRVEFITIFDMNGIRYSHPNANKIGYPIMGGDGERALHGESYISVATGTLGTSVRAFRPIFSHDQQQIGAVMVGQTLQKIDHITARTVNPIILALVVSLLLAVLLALWLSRNIKNILLGLEPFEMVKLFEERDAIIRTVKEGILVINRQGEITQINDEAKRILKADDKKDLIGQDISRLVPNTRLYDVMSTGKPDYDKEQNIGGVVILTNRTPLVVNGEMIGAVASFRDMTEMRTLAENLTGVNGYADALRSQSHEFNNKLHVIYGLSFDGNYLALQQYLEDLIGEQQLETDSIYNSVKDPIIAGFLKSKFSRAKELDVILDFTIEGTLNVISDSTITHRLITILGNLIDNSLDALQFMQDKRISVEMLITEHEFNMTIKDSGHGIKSGSITKIFEKGYSTKGDKRGFGLYLVLSCLDELGGHITLEPNQNNKEGACFNIIIPLAEIYGSEHND